MTWVLLPPAKMCFHTEMALVRVPSRTIAVDYHAFGALTPHPSLIL